MDWNIILCTPNIGVVEATTQGAMDWNIVLSTFIGALFGAICSYPIILLSNNTLKKIAVKKLTARIKNELTTNRNNLDKVKDDPTKILEFSSPLWDIIPSDLLLYIKDNETYTKIVKIYSAVRDLNKIENSITEVNDDNAERIIQQRKETLDIINKNMI